MECLKNGGVEDGSGSGSAMESAPEVHNTLILVSFSAEVIGYTVETFDTVARSAFQDAVAELLSVPAEAVVLTVVNTTTNDRRLLTSAGITVTLFYLAQNLD